MNIGGRWFGVLLLALLGVVAGQTARAETPPPVLPLTLYFDFFYNDIKAAAVTEVFTPQANGDYTITSHAEAQGLAKLLYGDVSRASAGKIHPETGLQMRSYKEQRGRRPLQTAEFNRQAGVVNLQKGKETRAEVAPAMPLLDYLTALYRSYVLGRAVAGAAVVTNGWRLAEYEYKIGEAEPVETPLATMLAVPVSRDSPRGRRVFWLAPERGYIPIKIYVDDKGHIFETVLTGIGGGVK